MNASVGKKVFVLGLDGATFDVIMPMAAKGDLPAFKKMMAGGVYGRLRSVVPPLSPPAWVTFATGKNPGKHGILGFTRMSPNSYRLKLVCGQDNRSKAVWEYLSSAGKKVIVVNVPMTYPPRPVNGLLVSGLDTPDVGSEFTYPAALKQEVFSSFPDYKINLQLGGYLQNDRRRAVGLRMIMESIDLRYRVSEYLMQKYPWDFFVVKFNNPDIVQHHFWKYMDPGHPEHDPGSRVDFRGAIQSVYKKLDQIVAALLARLGDDVTLVVMSDHGAGARLNKVVYLNEWLRQQGYLVKRNDADKRQGGRGKGLPQRFRAELEKPLSFLFRHTPPEARILLKNLLPDAFSKVSLHFKFSGWLSAIQWNRTSAFLAEQEYVRINQKGFYPSGTVEAAGYEGFRQDLIEKLKGLRDPATGETVFEDVLSREEAFGPSADRTLPDIQLVTRDAKFDITGSFFQGDRVGRDEFVRQERHFRGANGMHRPDGIFLMKGPFCRAGQEIEGLSLSDLCPTILSLFGLPLSKDLDGRVIEEGFREGFFSANPVAFADVENDAEQSGAPESVYSSDEESAIVDNLKSLGYMD